ncbi:uncharacterized protein STAUR_4788 [Stigmatella aurantiaca DW4/3-1]|uniref:Uncharacterized protein n=1 Tax=Stigmatella aurantiaca (strain DW4/3-1) TaxID=378806 RepID=E3FCR8_STIAD|nr:uncharacterized protein STAUR_4788 [Stigmatella aurantiaca DW4/3-1]
MTRVSPAEKARRVSREGAFQPCPRRRGWARPVPPMRNVALDSTAGQGSPVVIVSRRVVPMGRVHRILSVFRSWASACVSAVRRAHALGSCSGNMCVLLCFKEQDCPEGRRCNENSHCERGPRIGQRCEEPSDCQLGASCNAQKRCSKSCPVNGICGLEGYGCSPDGECVEACTQGPLEMAGLACETSLDCGRCGLCIPTNSRVKQCRQACESSLDCPNAGVCEKVGSSQQGACQLP